jgi:hypothetical protein
MGLEPHVKIWSRHIKVRDRYRRLVVPSRHVPAPELGGEPPANERRPQSDLSFVLW